MLGRSYSETAQIGVYVIHKQGVKKSSKYLYKKLLHLLGSMKIERSE